MALSDEGAYCDSFTQYEKQIKAVLALPQGRTKHVLFLYVVKKQSSINRFFSTFDLMMCQRAIDYCLTFRTQWGPVSEYGLFHERYRRSEKLGKRKCMCSLQYLFLDAGRTLNAIRVICSGRVD